MKNEASRIGLDVFVVEPRHYAIHERLSNWARWALGGRGNVNSICPMFRMLGYQSPRGRDPTPSLQIIDPLDASSVEKAVMQLPEKHRRAMVWWYVTKRPSPSAMRQRLGVTSAGLCKLCHDARTMLDNKLQA